MDPNENEEIILSPKDEIDYSQLSEAEKQAEFRRRRQEYLTEKESRKKEVKKRKKVQFGESSSDDSDSNEQVSRSSDSSAIKSDRKAKNQINQEFKPTKIDKQNSLNHQISPSKKKLQSMDNTPISLFLKKGNEWIKSTITVTQKLIHFQNVSEQIKKVNKIKIIAEPSLNILHRIKITMPDQQILFSVINEADIQGLNSSYYIFAKLIQAKLIDSGIKLKEAQQQKIPGVPQTLVTGSFIYGKIHKKSQVLGNWEERFVLINKEGIFSYKKFNQKHSMFIAAGSIAELWTRFQVQQSLLIVKIWHSSKKTEFGFPLTSILSMQSWLYSFFCMMGNRK